MKNRKTVILWTGQYSNDGLERLETLTRVERCFFPVHNPRLVGRPGAWTLIADMLEYIPHVNDYPIDAQP